MDAPIGPHRTRKPGSEEGAYVARTPPYLRMSPEGNRRGRREHMPRTGVPKVIASLGMACLVTGLITGWLLRSAFVTTQITRAQEESDRQIRYWQRQTRSARTIAEALSQRLAEHRRWPDGYDVPPADDDE